MFLENVCFGKKALCPMSNITCLHNVLWSLKKKKSGQRKGKQTVAFIPASTPFVVKVMPQGLTLKLACCNYCKAFSCSYIFIFHLGVLENEHMEGARAGDNQRTASPLLLWTGQDQRTEVYFWHLYPTFGNWDHGPWNHDIFQGLFRRVWEPA